MAQSRSPNRVLIILGALVGIIVLCVIIGAVGTFVLGGGGGNSGSSIPFTGSSADNPVMTAREAYPLAVNAVREIDQSAELASAAGAWTPAINSTNLADGRTGWTFHFYLPGQEEMARVVVDQRETARVIERQAWQTPPQLLDDQGWQIDSPRAMNSLLSSCQSLLDRDPDAEVILRLSTAVSNGTMVWQGHVISEMADGECQVVVDAIIGQIQPNN